MLPPAGEAELCESEFCEDEEVAFVDYGELEARIGSPKPHRTDVAAYLLAKLDEWLEKKRPAPKHPAN